MNNETERKSRTSDFLKNQAVEYLKKFGSFIGSHLYSAFLSFDIAFIAMLAIYDRLPPVTTLVVWILAWAIMRAVRYFAMQNRELLAPGGFGTRNMPFAVTFAIIGVITCFDLGKDLVQGKSSVLHSLIAVVGWLWMVALFSGLFSAAQKHYKDAQEAKELLSAVAENMANEDTKSITIHSRTESGEYKASHFVRVDKLPEELTNSENHEYRDVGDYGIKIGQKCG